MCGQEGSIACAVTGVGVWVGVCVCVGGEVMTGKVRFNSQFTHHGT